MSKEYYSKCQKGNCYLPVRLKQLPKISFIFPTKFYKKDNKKTPQIYNRYILRGSIYKTIILLINTLQIIQPSHS